MRSAARAAAVIGSSGGLVSVRILRQAGVDGRWIRKQIELGHWVEPIPGVIDATGATPTLAGRIAAAHVAAGPSSFVIGRSAAIVHGLMPHVGVLDQVQLGVPHGGHRVRIPGVVIRQFHRIPDLEVVQGLPVLSLGATLVNLAGELSLNDLRLVAAAAVHDGLVTIDEIQAARSSRLRAPPALALVIEELWAGAASGGEAAYWRGIKDAGLPLPELNARVHTEAGEKVVDALWRRYRLVAEVDGRSVHDTPTAFVEDRRRQNTLQLESLLVMRFPVSDVLSDLPQVIEVTESFLRLRAFELGLPWPPNPCT